MDRRARSRGLQIEVHGQLACSRSRAQLAQNGWRPSTSVEMMIYDIR